MGALPLSGVGLLVFKIDRGGASIITECPLCARVDGMRDQGRAELVLAVTGHPLPSRPWRERRWAQKLLLALWRPPSGLDLSPTGVHCRRGPGRALLSFLPPLFHPVLCSLVLPRGSFLCVQTAVAPPCKTGAISVAGLSHLCKLRGIGSAGSSDKGEIIGLLLLFMALLLSETFGEAPEGVFAHRENQTFQASSSWERLPLGGRRMGQWPRQAARRAGEGGGTPSLFLAMPSSSVAWGRGVFPVSSAWGAPAAVWGRQSWRQEPGFVGKLQLCCLLAR